MFHRWQLGKDFVNIYILIIIAVLSSVINFCKQIYLKFGFSGKLLYSSKFWQVKTLMNLVNGMSFTNILSNQIQVKILIWLLIKI